MLAPPQKVKRVAREIDAVVSGEGSVSGALRADAVSETFAASRSGRIAQMPAITAAETIVLKICRSMVRLSNLACQPKGATVSICLAVRRTGAYRIGPKR